MTDFLSTKFADKAGALSAIQKGAIMFDILFKNATIITMDDAQKVLYNANCGVSGKKITYVGKNQPSCGAKRTIDCKNNILMPGLINCHAHTAMTLLRGYCDDCSLNEWLFEHIFPAESRLDEKSVLSGFTLGVCEMLASGTTFFNDMYFYSDKAAKLADKIGIRGAFSNGVIALSDNYIFENDRAITELHSMLSESFSDRIAVQASIHCERTSPPHIWEKIVTLAKQYGLSLHIHLSETESDHNDCIKSYGMTPAQRLNQYGVFNVPTIAAHCVHLSQDDMRLLAQKQVTAVHNPVSNLKLASGIANIKQMLDMSVNVTLGTDGCSSNNTLDMFEDIKLAALLAKNKAGDSGAFSAYDALKLATVNGAKANGKENILGKICENFEADIILIDVHKLHRTPMHDPISTVVYCLGGNDVYMTLVQGKILYENGNFTTVDVNRAIETVNTHACKVIRGEV